MPPQSPALNPKQEQRLLFTLAGIQFTHILDFMIMMPLAPMLTRAFGLSTAQFGLLVSAYTFTAAASALAAATVIDRFNRRTVVLTLYAAFLLATLACAAAPGYALLLVARGAAGAFGGVLGAMVHTYIGDTIPFERRGRATGAVMAAFSMSTVVGVPLGLFFANHSGAIGWRAPFIFAALLAAIVFAIAVRTLPSIPSRARDLRISSTLKPMGQVLSDPNHWRAFAFMVLMMFGGFMVIPYLTLYTTANLGFPETLLPVMYLISGVCTLFTARWFGRLSDQYGKAKVFSVIAFLSMLPILALTHSPAIPWWGVIIIATPFSVLIAGRFVPGMALVTSAGNPQVRGTFMSINSAVQSAASGTAALLAGLIITRDAQGMILHYPLVGYIACAATLGSIWMAGSVRPADARAAAAPITSEAATSS